MNKEGTSAAAFKGAQYVSGGKTGTAQVFSLKGEKYSEHRVDERLRDHAWFMAYAPADHPQIALAVLVENGGFGAQAAAPIARKVIDHYLLGSTEPGAAPDRARAQRRRRRRLTSMGFLQRAWEVLDASHRLDAVRLRARDRRRRARHAVLGRRPERRARHEPGAEPDVRR